ncbi:galanin peptides-like [Denticeps clupeoides]|uniref:galanin peptides-like n=1 Tax=Denticeps clupeoides TaxID=299321 RepID=UPI0010A50909|nr:galanin peptides-like [Denticeps clupeoides]
MSKAAEKRGTRQMAERSTFTANIKKRKGTREMQSSTVLCVSLLLSALLSVSCGMVLVAPEKKGWTLNSAGYLLGPYAHRTLTLRHGSAVGKREIGPVEEFSSSPVFEDTSA